MLENLFALVQEQGQDAVVNNPAIPNEYNEVVLASATQTVTSGLQNELANGGLQNILAMFSNSTNSAGLMDNPVVNDMIGKFSNRLSNEQGLEASQANGIAGSLIPNVISKLINRTNDPNDNGFDLNGIIGSLTGGSTGGFNLQGLLGNFSNGLDANGDGQVGLDDIISKVTNGARQQQSGSGGGGLMDMIKGFMK
jgi:hypothetical protein